MLVSSREVVAALVQLLVAAFGEPERSSPLASIHSLPLAAKQVVQKEITSQQL